MPEDLLDALGVGPVDDRIGCERPTQAVDVDMLNQPNLLGIQTQRREFGRHFRTRVPASLIGSRGLDSFRQTARCRLAGLGSGLELHAQ